MVFYSNNSYLYPLVVNHIYIYAFSRRFYPKRLTVHSVCPFYFVSMFFLCLLNSPVYFSVHALVSNDKTTHLFTCFCSIEYCSQSQASLLKAMASQRCFLWVN